MSVKYFFLRLVSYRGKEKKAKKISTLPSTLFSMFLERIMPDGLEEHDEKASIGGRNITRLRFADGIGALAEEEQELEDLVESLDRSLQIEVIRFTLSAPISIYTLCSFCRDFQLGLLIPVLPQPEHLFHRQNAAW